MFLFSVSVVTLAALGQVPDTVPEPHIKAHISAPYVSTPPTIDGTLDESAWTGADTASRFRTEDGSLLNVRTIVKFLCDEKNLYIGVLLVDPEQEFVRTTATAEALYNLEWDDRLEFLFDPLNYPSPRARCARLVVNASGAILVEPISSPNPESKCEVGVVPRSTGLSAEISVPLEVFGVDILRVKNLWGVNIRRTRGCRRPGGGDQLSWHNPDQEFNDPANFATMVLGPTSEILVSQVRPLCEGVGLGNPVTIGARNLSESELDVTLFASVDGLAPSSPVTRQIPAGRSTFLRATYEIQEENPRQFVTTRLVQDQSGEELYRLRSPIDVPPRMQVGFRVPRYDHLLIPPAYALRGVVTLNAPQGDTRTFRMDCELISAATSQPVGKVSREVEPGASGVVIRAKDIPNGRAEFRVQITADDLPYARDALGLIKLTEDEAAALPVLITDESRLLVNGVPFFPVGWYASADTESLGNLTDTPFNCILAHGLDDKSDGERKEYLDTAGSTGLKVIYSPSERTPSLSKTGEVSSWQAAPDALRQHVTTWKSHPAILAWNIAEDPRVTERSQALSNYRKARELDIGHPTVVVLSEPERVPELLHSTDVFGIRALPVAGDVRDSGDSVGLAVPLARGYKPSWAILPVIGRSRPGSGGDSGTGTDRMLSRPPSRRELRYMTYLAVIRGAKGILYHSYDDLKAMSDFDERWAWLTEIGRELRQIESFILEGDRERVSIEEGEDAVAMRACVLGNRALVLVANLERERKEFCFRLPGTWAKAEVLFEPQAEPEFMSGYVKDSVYPLSVRAYQLTQTESESPDDQSDSSK